VLGAATTSSSTTRLSTPSTSKSIRKPRKCWWFGAATIGATGVPNRSPSDGEPMPRFSVVPVAFRCTSIEPS